MALREEWGTGHERILEALEIIEHQHLESRDLVSRFDTPDGEAHVYVVSDPQLRWKISKLIKAAVKRALEL